MAFDPDAYLAGGTTFDPDAYLKGQQPPVADKAASDKIAALDDPYSARSTVGRVATDIITGIPDLAIKIQNAGLNPFTLPARVADKLLGTEQPTTPIPEIGPYVRSAIGVPDLPQDASTVRRLGEAAATMVGSVGTGAPAASREIVRDVVKPMAGATVGGNVGGWVGGDTGSLLGSLIGGVGPSFAAQRGARGARPDATEIAEAAQRQSVTPTAGMVGDLTVQAQENALSGKRGSSGVISQARQTALEQMRAAAERGIEARQALPAATPETADIHNVATTARAQGTDVSSAAQQRLMDRVGPTRSVDVAPVIAEMERVRSTTDPGTYAPIDARVEYLRQMLPRDPQGNVTGSTVDYQRFKDWRSGLGRRMNNLDPIPGRFSGGIYDAATGAMRDTATAAGVHPQEFALAQDITRNQMRANEIREVYDRTLGNVDQTAAGPRGFARWWNSLMPQEQAALAGPQNSVFADVARLSRAYNYPTGQTGLTRSLGGQLADLGDRAAGAAVGSLLSTTGIPGAGQAGAAAGAMGISPVRNWMRARALEGRRASAMARGPQPMTIDDLIGAMQAARIGAR
jgi:hypothetical protein